MELAELVYCAKGWDLTFTIGRFGRECPGEGIQDCAINPGPYYFAVEAFSVST